MIHRHNWLVNARRWIHLEDSADNATQDATDVESSHSMQIDITRLVLCNFKVPSELWKFRNYIVLHELIDIVAIVFVF